MKHFIYIAILACSLNANIFGQKTSVYTHNLATYNAALELYDKEKFSAAQDKFAAALKAVDEKKSEIAVNSKYYHAICGLELFNINAENLLIEFTVYLKIENVHWLAPPIVLGVHAPCPPAPRIFA